MGSNSSKPVLCQAQVQVLRKCEICKIDKDVYYKCDQCQVYTCNKCSRIHQQTSTHNITEIGFHPPKLVQQTAESEYQGFADRKCGLCLTYMMTQYRCSKCQTVMCFKCGIIHLRLFHSINNIKSFSTTERCACKIPNKKFKFCYTCLMKPICSACISAHKYHQVLSLEHQTLILNGRLSKDLEFTSLVLTQIFKQEFENSLIFQNILEEVEQRKNSTETTTNYTKLRENMEAEQIKLRTNFNDYKSNLSHFKQILEALKSKLEAAKEGNNEDNISTVLLESLSSLPHFHFRKLLQQIENLVPKKSIETARSFGIQVKERKKQSNIDIKLMMSYKTNFTSIKKIVTLNHKKALITEYPSEILCILDIKDDIITSKDLSIMVMDMSVTPSKEILLNLINHDALHLLTGEGTKPFLSVTPHQVFIHCIHVTKNNEIILGVEDYSTIKGMFEFGNESKTKLMIFGTDKKQKQSLDYDAYKQRLFTLPYRITSNINNEILVIDRRSMYDGRVMALNREGQVRWIYEGHPNVYLTI